MLWVSQGKRVFLICNSFLKIQIRLEKRDFFLLELSHTEMFFFIKKKKIYYYYSYTFYIIRFITPQVPENLQSIEKLISVTFTITHLLLLNCSRHVKAFHCFIRFSYVFPADDLIRWWHVCFMFLYRKQEIVTGSTEANGLKRLEAI